MQPLSIYTIFPQIQQAVARSPHAEQVSHLEFGEAQLWCPTLCEHMSTQGSDHPITVGGFGEKNLPYILVRYIDDKWNAEHNNLPDTKSLTAIFIGVIPNVGLETFAETVRAEESASSTPTLHLLPEEGLSTAQRITEIIAGTLQGVRLA